jgi:hypothetical protein
VLEGRATIQGQQVVRAAPPAEEMMQAFIYHHLVPANDLMVTVSGKARARFPGQLLHAGPIKIPAGGTAQVKVAIPRSTNAEINTGVRVSQTEKVQCTQIGLRPPGSRSISTSPFSIPILPGCNRC